MWWWWCWVGRGARDADKTGQATAHPPCIPQAPWRAQLGGSRGGCRAGDGSAESRRGRQAAAQDVNNLSHNSAERTTVRRTASIAQLNGEGNARAKGKAGGTTSRRSARKCSARASPAALPRPGQRVSSRQHRYFEAANREERAHLRVERAGSVVLPNAISKVPLNSPQLVVPVSRKVRLEADLRDG